MHRLKKAKACEGILLDGMNKQKQHANWLLFCRLLKLWFKGTIFANFDSMGAEDLFLLRLLQLFTTSGRHRRLEAEEGR